MFEQKKLLSDDSTDSLNNISQENILKLPLLEAISMCSVLEDITDQIIILGSIESTTDSKIQLKIDKLKKRAEKYAKNDPIFNVLNGELFTHTLYKQKFLKLHSDRAYLEEILVQIRIELLEEYSFRGLIEFLKEQHAAKMEEESLIINESDNKAYSAYLKEEVKKKMEQSRDELQKANETISKYKDDIETILFDHALKLRYVESWETARVEQGFMICDKNENDLIETINKYKNEIEKEIRINSEIEAYIAENQKDIEEGIETWMGRYERELEEKQTEIQMYKDKREEQEKRYKEMLEIFEEHAIAIQDFLDYKERKRIQEELDILWNEAAVKIQAWWRGLMVRLQLGPFNPNPKKKGRKGKKGKGKKKK